ncbi:hypothetical protein [Sphingomonas sanxanigenens]|uniref:Uncharacterized protein n=1 Tax=Sphingomonas sanxanigenens DSM 19645 = NX02 TaxID=1123269 RepID=W0A3W9_9SPHN|nr:hypothetical protein [Sphingomonas sanxanigenens]AHE52649.1 hypothetical protein NX02_04525 [Sphingomonas sanxanigenens DSM 19645 = NX02]
MSFDWSLLLGPYGGVVAGAFGTGCAAGYAFCVRTILKVSDGRLDEFRAEIARERKDCDERISSINDDRREERKAYEGRISRLEKRVFELEDRSYTGQLRQMAQVRQSSKDMGIIELGGTPDDA